MVAVKSAFLLLVALALSPFGNAQPIKVSVVPVESVDDFKHWLGKPIGAARAEAAASYPGTLTHLPFGTKTQLPIPRRPKSSSARRSDEV